MDRRILEFGKRYFWVSRLDRRFCYLLVWVSWVNSVVFFLTSQGRRAMRKAIQEQEIEQRQGLLNVLPEFEGGLGEDDYDTPESTNNNQTEKPEV